MKTTENAQLGTTPALANPALLEKIDKLFACNVGEHINLPQLVVVGDQSSGKSSVLEGLTKLKFPRNSGLCTRFATQIIFRRAPDLATRKVNGSIISSTTHDEGNEAADWSMSDIEALSEGEFENMMDEVHEAMGLSTSIHDGLPTFSHDILRLEIHGPHENHLSVIDVPGIFKTTTPGLTTKSDIVLVRDMVLNYMRNPRSIMLAVVPANVDIATQEIIEIARELDPDGQRTLRILTKPDLVDEGAEDKIIELVERKPETQGLGWVVVKNLGQKDLQDTSKIRDIEEDKFRNSPPWNRLSKENYGIEALGLRLQALLASNVRREFPKVRFEVTKRLKECRKDLESLGGERESPEQQSRYLLEVVSKFQRITENALRTNYGSQDFFDEYPSLRLATLVANRNAQFSEELSTQGHVYCFEAHDHDDDSENDPKESVTSTPNSVGSQVGEDDYEDKEAYDELNSLPSRKIDICHDIEDILHDGVQIEYSKAQGILPWIENLYLESRGFELGTFSSSLLSTVMKKQSAKWPSLAEGLLSDLDFSRQERIASAVKKSSFSVDMKDGTNRDCYQVSDLARIHHMSNSEQTVEDIHDILKSYYKVARKRFVDNVCMQAADFHLVTGPEAPMNIFSPSWVYCLTDEQLEHIAGEELSIRRKRHRLQQETKDLEAGRKILH
ncbi:Dynamin [Penicillium expansum]|nr:Dynamin [Penicillium expansum]